MGNVEEYEENIRNYEGQLYSRLTDIVLNQWNEGEMPGWYFIDATLTMAETEGVSITFDDQYQVVEPTSDTLHSNVSWIEPEDLFPRNEAPDSSLTKHYRMRLGPELDREIADFGQDRILYVFDTMEKIMKPSEVEKRGEDSAYRFRYTQNDLQNLIQALENTDGNYLEK